MRTHVGSAVLVGLVATLALAGCGHPKGAAHGTEAPPPSAPIDAAVALAPDAGPAPTLDSDRDGIPDVKDLCPLEPMVMSAGCEPARQQGCPDDCRPPLHVEEPMR